MQMLQVQHGMQSAFEQKCSSGRGLLNIHGITLTSQDTKDDLRVDSQKAL